MRDELQDFLTHIANNRAASTRASYGTGMRRLNRYLPVEVPLEEMRLKVWIGYIDHLGTQQLTNAVRRTYVLMMWSFVQWAVSRERVTMTPAQLARLSEAVRNAYRKREARLPRTPAKGHVERMVAQAARMRDPSPRQERNVAMVEFLASSGCRVGELVSLVVADLNLEERSARVVGKGSRERVIFFSSRTVELLNGYWAVRGSSLDTDPVFSRHDKRLGAGGIAPIREGSVQVEIKRIALRAGVPFTPHMFRHAFAMTMVARTSLPVLQDMLGHASPVTTRVYAKISSSDLKKEHHNVYE